MTQETSQGLQVRALPLGPIGTNCYVVTVGGERAIVIDPGADPEQVLEAVRTEHLQVEAVLVTHCHWDHIGAVAPVARGLKVPVYMSRLEAPVLENIEQFAPAEFGPYEPYTPEHLLDGGERLDLMGTSIEVLHLPGHSPGTMGFYLEPDTLFVGDLIFRGSVGRVDLPYADGAQLLDSARHIFDRFDDETVLYSGHGPATTVGHERRTNPFLRDL